MQLICLSVSHHNTPVKLRECLNLPVEALEETLPKFPIRSGAFEPLTEMLILSTCNRLEIYAVITLAEEKNGSADSHFLPVLAYLQQAFNIPAAWVEPYFRRFSGNQAVRHLFQVAAGLDSIAIGETQILGQVSRGLEVALRLGTARHVLSSLFRAAIHTGKRVRTETEIGRRPTNISTLAVQLAEEAFGGLSDRKTLVVGAGKMGQYTLEALQQRGLQEVSLTSRTFDHAAELASRFGNTPLPYENLFDALVDADVVFSSAAAPQPIIRQELLSQVMARRSERALALVDLAVPRNIEPQARQVPGVQVFDMDDLQSFARSAQISQAEDIAHAEAIVAEEAAGYEKLLRIIPFIGELHKKVEAIRQREVEKALRRLRTDDPEVTAQFAAQMEVLSKSLVQKILHEPTMHLRTETNQETLNDYVDALGSLFDLSESETSLSLQEGE